MAEVNAQQIEDAKSLSKDVLDEKGLQQGLSEAQVREQQEAILRFQEEYRRHERFEHNEGKQEGFKSDEKGMNAKLAEAVEYDKDGKNPHLNFDKIKEMTTESEKGSYDLYAKLTNKEWNALTNEQRNEAKAIVKSNTPLIDKVAALTGVSGKEVAYQANIRTIEIVKNSYVPDKDGHLRHPNLLEADQIVHQELEDRVKALEENRMKEAAEKSLNEIAAGAPVVPPVEEQFRQEWNKDKPDWSKIDAWVKDKPELVNIPDDKGKTLLMAMLNPYNHYDKGVVENAIKHADLTREALYSDGSKDSFLEADQHHNKDFSEAIKERATQ